MNGKDYYEDLCKFYEIFAGEIPERDNFKEALKKTISEKYLKSFFLIPTSGNIRFSKLLKKTGLPENELLDHLKSLALEGFIIVYEADNELCCERRDIVGMTEEQVRKSEDSGYREVFARVFNGGIEGDLGVAIETKTPFFRVIPSESSITKPGGARTIDIDIDLPKAGEVLPVDIISEMIKKEAKLIGVAECFCRLTKRHLGEGCEHPLETCFVFNELAQCLINNGTARKIDYREAMQIIEDCEKRGLIHNIDNCSANIRVACNCCPSCCIVLKSIGRGEKYAGTTSRYVAQFDRSKCNASLTCISRCPTGARRLDGDMVSFNPDKCIGCGLCVTTCPAGANSMVLRKTKQKIPATRKKLIGKITREAIFSVVKKKILRK